MQLRHEPRNSCNGVLPSCYLCFEQQVLASSVITANAKVPQLLSLNLPAVGSVETRGQFSSTWKSAYLNPTRHFVDDQIRRQLSISKHDVVLYIRSVRSYAPLQSLRIGVKRQFCKLSSTKRSLNLLSGVQSRACPCT